MAAPKFVHFDVHSDLSFTDSTLTVPALVGAAKRDAARALVIADRGNLYAAAQHHRLAAKHNIKPISGVQLEVEDPDCGIGILRLYGVSEGGYETLCRIISAAGERTRTQGALGVLPIDELLRSAEGLAVLTGGRRGVVNQAFASDAPAAAERALARLQEGCGGYLFAEMQRSGFPGEEDQNRQIVTLADSLDVPLIATHPVRFMAPDDLGAHRVREAAAARRKVSDFSGPHAPTTAGSWWRSPEQMAALFPDLAEALTNTVHLAEAVKCTPPFSNRLLPEYPDAPGAAANGVLRKLAVDGLQRLGIDDQAHRDRLEYELGVIAGQGFSGYILIVADYVMEAKRRGMEVGPGRGSGAGSLVAYTTGITDIDPLPYGLLFERFLNPERPSLPDFDCDFPPARRDEIIRYMRERYGAERVAQIGAVSRIGLRSAVNDTVRALGASKLIGRRLAELMPEMGGKSVEAELESNAVLRTVYDNSGEAREILDHAAGIVGLARHTSIHAAGVVISPEALTAHSPITPDRPGDPPHLQISGEDAEASGLVKFDILGLTTLSVIQDATEHADAHAPIGGIDTDEPDPLVLELLSSGHTSGVFQLESCGMQRILHEFRPDSLEELAMVISLFRPGPLQTGMVESAIKRKHGFEKIDYPHPLLEPILRDTYGVIIYQEQVMRAAQELASYSLAEADILRKAMGKKKAAEMESQRQRFVEGCEKNGISGPEAESIFQLMAKFAGYGFNRAHAIAYATISWRAAWLKAHYPDHYAAAVLTGAANNPRKLLAALYEAKRSGVAVRPPNINESQRHFVADGRGGVLYGLSAIKNLGEKGLQALLDEREANGPFQGLVDLHERTRLGKTAMHSLIDSGSMSLWGHLGQLRAANDALQSQGKKSQAAQEAAGQMSMFDGGPPGAAGDGDAFVNRFADERASTRDVMAAERRALDAWLSGHPIDDYGEIYTDAQAARLVDVLSDMPDENASEEELAAARKGRSATIAGIVVARRDSTMKGNVASALVVEDATSRIEVRLSPAVRRNCEEALHEGAALRIGGTMLIGGRNAIPYLRADRVETLDDLRQRSVKRLVVDLRGAGATSRERLVACLRGAREGGTVVEGLDLDGGPLAVALSPELWDEIGKILPPGTYRGEYGDADESPTHQTTPIQSIDAERALLRNRAEWDASIERLQQAMPSSAM